MGIFDLRFAILDFTPNDTARLGVVGQSKIQNRKSKMIFSYG